MRVAEIISDFRTLQHYLASIRANPSSEEYYEEGYIVLRQCAAEAQALLLQPFTSQALSPRGNEEHEKAQLKEYARLEFQPILPPSHKPQSSPRFKCSSIQGTTNISSRKWSPAMGEFKKCYTERTATSGRPLSCIAADPEHLTSCRYPSVSTFV